MGIDLSGKFSPKTRKTMLLLGKTFGKSTPIEFKDTIDPTVTDENNNEVTINIKAVNLSTTDSQLKANIKAMVKDVKDNNIKNVNLVHFFGKDGILACLSNSSFTSSSSKFKQIYKSISKESAELLITNVDYIPDTEVTNALRIVQSLQEDIITYLTREKRNSHENSEKKFVDGGTIDKCKVVVCHTLLLVLKQKEDKLKTRLKELQQNAKLSSSSSSTNKTNTASPNPSKNTAPKVAKKEKKQKLLDDAIKNVITACTRFNNFIDASEYNSIDSLVKFLDTHSEKKLISNGTGYILVAVVKDKHSFAMNYEVFGQDKFVKQAYDYIDDLSEDTDDDPTKKISAICAKYNDYPIIFVKNEFLESTTAGDFEIGLQLTQYITSANKTLAASTAASDAPNKTEENLKAEAAAKVEEEEKKQLLDDAIKDVITTCKNDNFIDASTQKNVNDLVKFLDTHSKKELISKAIGFILVNVLVNVFVKSPKPAFAVHCTACGDKTFVTNAEKYIAKHHDFVDSPVKEISEICNDNKNCPIILVSDDIMDPIDNDDSKGLPILDYIASADNQTITDTSNSIKTKLLRVDPTPIHDTIKKDIADKLKLPELKQYTNSIAEALESYTKSITESIEQAQKSDSPSESSPSVAKPNSPSDKFPKGEKPQSLSEQALTALQNLWESTVTALNSELKKAKTHSLKSRSSISDKIPKRVFSKPSAAASKNKLTPPPAKTPVEQGGQTSTTSDDESSSMTPAEKEQIKKMDECTSKLQQEYDKIYNDYNGPKKDDNFIKTCKEVSDNIKNDKPNSNLRMTNNAQMGLLATRLKPFLDKVDLLTKYLSDLGKSATEAQNLLEHSEKLGLSSEYYTTAKSKLENAIAKHRNLHAKLTTLRTEHMPKVVEGRFNFSEPTANPINQPNV